MKAEDLFENMSAIDDEVLERSEQTLSAGGDEQARSRKVARLRRIAAAAAVVLVVGAAVWMLGKGIFREKNKMEKNTTTTVTVTVTPGGEKQGGNREEEKVSEWEKYLTKYRLAKAEYPKAAVIPNMEDYKTKDGQFLFEAYDRAYRKWSNASYAHMSGFSASQRTTALNGVSSFAQSGMAQLLSGETGTNRVYSPANLYMALAMLAEVTDGDTRTQVMRLLGVNDIGLLREMSDTAWNLMYRDNGLMKSVLAGALWLRDDDACRYIPDTVERLAKTYHASTFRGTMGSAEYDQALRAWLNEQTGGLLSDSVKDQKFDELTALTIATTLYFNAKWSHSFGTYNTYEQTFHAQSGDVTCDFMHQTFGSGTYFAGDKFAAVCQYFDDDYQNNHMVYFLPDEGVSVEELLSDPQVFALLGGEQEKPTCKDNMLINFAVPKFDISSNMELSEKLQKLGITDAFDMGKADFSALVENSQGIWLSKVNHSVRVKIDEEGVEAAAFTVMPAVGASMPSDDEVDFVLDRPFVFAICASNGTPLFVGIVENP